MKTIANFGAFVCDTWAIWLFSFGAGLWLLLAFTGPKTVTLDDKHWSCTMAVPDGISTRCTEYNYKGK